MVKGASLKIQFEMILTPDYFLPETHLKLRIHKLICICFSLIFEAIM